MSASLTGCCDWLLTGLTQVLNLRARSRMQTIRPPPPHFRFREDREGSANFAGSLRQGFPCEFSSERAGSAGSSVLEDDVGFEVLAVLENRSGLLSPTCGAPALIRVGLPHGMAVIISSSAR